MARLFYSGFETGDFTNNGGVQNSTGSSFSFTTAVKRTGNYSLRLAVNVSAGNWYNQVLETEPDEIYVRFAFRHPYAAAQSGAGTNRPLFRIAESSVSHIELRMDMDTTGLKLYVIDTIQDSSALAIPEETWHMIEVYAKIANSGGQVTVKLNGTTILTYSGDTCHGANEYAEVVSLGWNLSTATEYVWFDDFAINDTTGSYQNSWIGLGGVFYLKPDADGYQNDWTPSTGADNYAMVDETPPDNATTYNQAVTSGDIDSYSIDDCPAYIDIINCVQVIYQAALAESGYNQTTDQLYIAGTAYDGTESTIVPITPNFTPYEGTIWYTNPNSSGGTVAWGTADVNGMEAGLRITV